MPISILTIFFVLFSVTLLVILSTDIRIVIFCILDILVIWATSLWLVTANLHIVLIRLLLPLVVGVLTSCVGPNDFSLLGQPTTRTASFTSARYIARWTVLRELRVVLIASLVSAWVDVVLFSSLEIVVKRLLSTPASPATPSSSFLLSVVLGVLHVGLWTFLFHCVLAWSILRILVKMLRVACIHLFVCTNHVNLFSVLLFWLSLLHFQL